MHDALCLIAGGAAGRLEHDGVRHRRGAGGGVPGQRRVGALWRDTHRWSASKWL